MGGFNEGDHPRVPAGSPQGGEFASKGGGRTFSAGTHIGHPINLDNELGLAGKKYLQRHLTKEMVADIAGAPPGSKVHIEVGDYSIDVTVRNDAGYYSQRSINLRKRIVTNEESKNPNQGKGEGLKILAMQVEAARAVGLHRIDTYAAGRGSMKKGKGKEGTYNGYYSWLRMGFMPEIIGGGISQQIQDRHGNHLNVLRLMSTKTGRDYWKDHGQGFQGQFDLRPNSISSRVLEAYLKESK